MGVPVTVDSDDLFTACYAAGIIKPVEAALEGAKRAMKADPLFPTPGELTLAIDRLMTEQRRAKRRATGYPRPEAHEPPTDEELGQLLGCGLSPENPLIPSGNRTPMQRVLEAQHLKGLIEFGAVITHVAWGGIEQPERMTLANWCPLQLVRLTAAGRQALEAYLKSLAPPAGPPLAKSRDDLHG